MTSLEKRGLIAWFVRNPVAANLLMALIIAWGVSAAFELPREGFPSLPSSRVTVDVSYPSGSPSAAEEGIVLRVEAALQGIPGLERMTSVATAEGASITLVKDLGYDLDKLLSDVKARVDSIPNLPRRAERPVISREEREEDAYLIWVQIHSEHADRHTLEELASGVRRDLLRHPSIRRVERAGSRSPEIHIELTEEALQRYGLALNDVSELIQAESLNGLQGQLRSRDRTIAVKADEQAYWKRDFQDLPLLTTNDGTLVRLGDVANVTDTYAQAPHVWMRYQGQPSVGLQVFKDPNSDTEAARQAIDETLRVWRGDKVPETIRLSTWDDQTVEVQERMSLMLRNGILGALLVFSILALSIDFRVAFWVAMGLPVAFGGALAAMSSSWLGLSLNDLTTFGMIVALGIVVDDAVVIGESVYSERRRGGLRVVSTISGVHRVAVPTVFGVLTTVAAFSVLPFVDGTLGQVFAQFAMVISVVLVFSIIESKLILPAHLAGVKLDSTPTFWPSRKLWELQRTVDHYFELLAVMYQRGLRFLLEWRYVTLIVLLTISVATVGFVARGAVRVVFFPDIPGQVVTASMSMAEGAGYGLTEQNLRRLESAAYEAAAGLSPTRDPKDVLSAVQVHQSDDTAGRVNAEIVSRQELATAEDLVRAWRSHAVDLEGLESLTISADFDDDEDDDIVELELSSNDESAALLALEQLRRATQQMAGIQDVRSNASLGRAELRLELTEQGRASGLTVANLAEQVQQAFFGYEVQRFQRGEDELRVRVRYPAKNRSDESDLAALRIRAPDGLLLPLTTVATIDRIRTPLSITRIDGRRVVSLAVTADKSVSSPTEVLEELERSVFPNLAANFPTVEIVAAGEVEEIDRTTRSFVKLLLLAIGLIYILLAVPLKSYVQPVLIMGAIPFGVLGAIVGHWVHSVPVSLLSMFGMLALAGVVINDSLLLAVAFNRERASVENVKVALAAAGGSRLRAIVLTSVTTYVGLIPLVFETSEQAQYLIPAAIALAYGVLFATVLTLILVPLLLSFGSGRTRGQQQPDSGAQDSSRLVEAER